MLGQLYELAHPGEVPPVLEAEVPLAIAFPGAVDLSFQLHPAPGARLSVLVGASRPESELERERQILSLHHVFVALAQVFPAIADLRRAFNGDPIATES